MKKPKASTTSTKPGTDFIAGTKAGTTWYQRKIWTSNGTLRNSSTQALPKRTSHGLSGSVRSTPITPPATNANINASSDTDTVHPQADSIQSR
ncbi:hypothetical protein D3C86_1737520 [compost metagenome]